MKDLASLSFFHTIFVILLLFPFHISADLIHQSSFSFVITLFFVFKAVSYSQYPWNSEQNDHYLSNLIAQYLKRGTYFHFQFIFSFKLESFAFISQLPRFVWLFWWLNQHIFDPSVLAFVIFVISIVSVHLNVLWIIIKVL